MKKTIIITLVLALAFVARFCTHTIEIVESRKLPNTECAVATVKAGKTTGYALAQDNELLTSAEYTAIHTEFDIIVANLKNGNIHIFNRHGQRINNMDFTGCNAAENYAVLHSSLGKYIYNPKNDMLSDPYEEVIPQKNSFWVKAVNGWGVLNSELECIIPTRYASPQQFPQH